MYLSKISIQSSEKWQDYMIAVEEIKQKAINDLIDKGHPITDLVINERREFDGSTTITIRKKWWE